LNRYFDKERDFIASFYERKGSRSGKFIYKKIMSIEEDVVEEVIFLYLLMKQRKHMMAFYDEKVEYIEHKIKFSKMLQRKLKAEPMKPSEDASRQGSPGRSPAASSKGAEEGEKAEPA